MLGSGLLNSLSRPRLNCERAQWQWIKNDEGEGNDTARSLGGSDVQGLNNTAAHLFCPSTA